jgi:hypothetical protein
VTLQTACHTTYFNKNQRIIERAPFADTDDVKKSDVLMRAARISTAP